MNTFSTFQDISQQSNILTLIELLDNSLFISPTLKVSSLIKRVGTIKVGIDDSSSFTQMSFVKLETISTTQKTRKEQIVELLKERRKELFRIY